MFISIMLRYQAIRPVQVPDTSGSDGYGVVLGLLRYASLGLLAPIPAHVFAGITIAVIVMEVTGKI